MPKREALRELQERLNSRLKAARGGERSAQWLAVRAGKGYLLALSDAGEICPIRGLQTVPRTRPWFLGVLQVRGQMLGVADLQSFAEAQLSTASTPPAAKPNETATPRNTVSLVTLHPALGLPTALAVQSLHGLRTAEDFSPAALPTGAAPAPWLGPLLRDAAGEFWQVLDLRALAASPEFLNISA